MAGKTPDGLAFAMWDNNDDSFREGARTVRTGINWWGAGKIADSLSTATTNVLKSNNAAAVEKVKAVEATKQLQITKDAEAAAAEAAAAAVPP